MMSRKRNKSLGCLRHLTTMTTLAAGFLALLLFLYFLIQISHFATKGRSQGEHGKAEPPPQATGAWPVIGHLHLLAGTRPTHITLASMADKFGPVFTIKLGSHRALVVSGWEVAKDCFTTNDRAFASRPKSSLSEIIGYNYGMFGLAPYGSYWREVRKIAVLQLLSHHQVEMLGEIRSSEVKSTVRGIHKSWFEARGRSETAKIEMKQRFGDMLQSVVVRIIAGKIYSPGDEEAVEFQKMVKEFARLLGVFVFSDAIPWLRLLDLGGHLTRMKMTAKGMDKIMEGWLQEHRRRRKPAESKGEQNNFMDILLSVLEDRPAGFSGFDSDTIVKANSLSILAAATDTTTVTLTWALSLLLNNPESLRKVQEELDRTIGRERNVEESELKDLAYLQAVVKETLRLYPGAPLSVPHESLEDCIVAGYHIPKGTQLLVNIWKIHRDGRVWADPHEFRPERFLTTHREINVGGQSFELMPFGSGRRMCPGISFAMQMMTLALASLLHAFEFSRPSDDPIDMTEGLGLTLVKTTPLEVLVAPRLSPLLFK